MSASSNLVCNRTIASTSKWSVTSIFTSARRLLGGLRSRWLQRRPHARKTKARRVCAASRGAGRLRSRSIRAEKKDEAWKPTVRDLPAHYRAALAKKRLPTLPPGGRKRVALYARFSTAKQKFASIEIQLERARRRAAELNLVIVIEYSEIADTGKNQDRIVFNKMMADAVAGKFDAIIFYNVSRFSRTWRHSMSQYDRLHDCGVTVHNIQQELDEEKMLSESIRAQKDHSEKVQGFQEGRLKAVEKNRVPQPPVFGHMIQPGKPGEHVKHPEHSKTVERIFDLLDQGVGASTVANMMTLEDRLTPADASRQTRADPKDPVRHAAWSTDMVQSIRRNLRYTGLISYNGEQSVYDRNFDVIGCTSDEEKMVFGFRVEMEIVDREKYDRVQLSDYKNYNRGVKIQRRVPSYYPFAGLIHCAICGNRMKITSSLPNQPAYYCDKVDNTKRARCPGSGYHPVSTVDRVVIERLREALQDRPLGDYSRKYLDELERLTLAEDAHRAELETKHAAAQDAVKDVARLQINSEKLPIDHPDRYPENILVAMRRAAIEAERDALTALSSFEGKSGDTELLEDLDTLERAFGDVGSILEGIGKKVDGGRFQTAIRRIVLHVALSRPLSKRALATILTAIPKAAQPGEDWAVEWPHEQLDASWDIKAQREVKASEQREIRKIRLADLAAGNEFAIGDAAFKVASEVTSSSNYDCKGQDLRTIINAMFFFKKAHCDWVELPASFGDRHLLDLAYHRLIYNLIWDGILDRWDEVGLADVYKPLSRRELEFPSCKRKPNPSGGAIVLTPAAIRAKKAGKAVRVQKRMEGVALLIEGCKPPEIADRLGVSLSAPKSWRRYIRCTDVDDIDDKPKLHFLAADEVEEIRNIVAEKRDQGDWKGMPSLEELYEQCKGKGVPFRSKKALASALNRANIYLSKQGKRK